MGWHQLGSLKGRCPHWPGSMHARKGHSMKKANHDSHSLCWIDCHFLNFSFSQKCRALCDQISFVWLNSNFQIETNGYFWQQQAVHRKAFYTHTPLEKCNRLLYCTSKIQHNMVKNSKTCAIRRKNSRHKAPKVFTAQSKIFSWKKQQNLCQKAATLSPKGSKSMYCALKFFFPHTKKFVLHTKKIAFVLQK